MSGSHLTPTANPLSISLYAASCSSLVSGRDFHLFSSHCSLNSQQSIFPHRQHNLQSSCVLYPNYWKEAFLLCNKKWRFNTEWGKGKNRWVSNNRSQHSLFTHLNVAGDHWYWYSIITMSSFLTNWCLLVSFLHVRMKCTLLGTQQMLKSFSMHLQ